MHQIIGILIFFAIVLILVAAGFYFARGQNPRSQHSGSWPNVLGPLGNSTAMGLGERLNRDIEAGQNGGNRHSRRH